jgi:hypothetical protein
MQRTLCILLTLGLATPAIVPSLEAHAADASNDVQLFLNRAADGSLALTEKAPSSRNATTWTLKGSYYGDQGLKLVVPLSDPNPNWVLDESQGADGWITYKFKQTRSGTLNPMQGYNYGSFHWLMVEGARSSEMRQDCVRPNQTNDYDCDEYRYVAAFPGHEDGGAPHTHGDGTDADRGLLSGDLQWLLTYTVPPCSSLTSLCSYAGSRTDYEFSVVLDGTTFLHYVAVDEDHPAAPASDASPASNETGNQTEGDGNETASEDGNETGNQTGEGSEGNAFRPQPYDAQTAMGTAPGAGLGAILATIAVGIALRRRRA